MSSQFYQRYIPAVKSPGENDVISTIGPAVKKRKANIRPQPVDDPTTQKPSQGAKRPKSKKDSTEIISNNSESDHRHAKLRSRYEQAAAAPKPPPQSEAALLQALELADEPKELHGLEPLPQPEEVNETAESPIQSTLPRWIQSPLKVSDSDTRPFTSFPLCNDTSRSLRDVGFTQSFAVQSIVLPLLLPDSDAFHDGDLCIAAQTGSGKTLAYSLPMVESLRSKPVRLLRGLVVVPTQILVNQVYEVFQTCARYSDLKIETATGSKPLKTQQDLLVQVEQRLGWRMNTESSGSLVGVKQNHVATLHDHFDHFRGTNGEHASETEKYRSKVDILVCTPGRLVEHIQSTRGFTLEHVQWLVIDEADRLFDDNFQLWLEKVIPKLDCLPPLDAHQKKVHKTFHLFRQRQIRKIILSASMTRNMSSLMSLKLRNPKLIQLEGQGHIESQDPARDANTGNKLLAIPEKLTEAALPIRDPTDKPLYLLSLLDESLGASRPEYRSELSSTSYRGEDEDTSTLEDDSTSSNCSSSSDTTFREPSSSQMNVSADPIRPERPSSLISALKPHGILIFVNTNENALRLARLITLLRPTHRVSPLTKLSAASGRKTLKQFRNRELSILVASDRASRGLDLPGLAHVINYDMPSSVENYVHRVGRTARAGLDGRATTLVEHQQARWFWNEVAKADDVQRNSQKPVTRLDGKLNEAYDSLAERATYEEALRLLGEESGRSQQKPSST